MKYLLVPLLIALSGAAHAVQDCELDGKHINPDNGNSTAGKTGLMRCKDRDTGLVQREQELRDGKYVGIVRYYDKGKLVREHSTNEKGNREGRAREFAPDGTVLSDSMQENGRTVGISKRFHPNGKLRRVGFHEEDSEKASAEFNDQGRLSDLRCFSRAVLAPVVDDATLCGFSGKASQVEQYNGRDTLSSKVSWLEGKRVRYEQFYGNGKTQLLQENAPTRTLEQNFSQDGVKRRETERVLDGKTITSMKLLQFSEAGSLVRDQRWSLGRPVSDTSFYLNGQPKNRSVTTYSDAGAAIEETDYGDDGKVYSIATYLEPSRGRRIATGTHKGFNAAGRVVSESTYDARGKITRERAWDDAGTLLRDDAVFEDGSRKAFAK